MEKEFVLNRVNGCLFGMAVGDALGMPANGMSRYDVSKKYQVLDNYFPRGEIPGGTRTWISMSSFRICEAILIEGLTSQAMDLAFGKMKQDELLMDDSFEAYTKKEQSLKKSARTATRSVAVGLYAALHGPTEQELIKACKIPVVPTHANKQVVIASFVVAKIISDCIRNRKGLEHQFDLYQGDKSLLARLIIFCRLAEDAVAVTHDKLSERLLSTRRMLQKRASTDEFLGYNGNSRSIDECICFSLFSFFRGPDSFQSLTNVVSSGGEASLNGALTGALIGAYTGPGFMMADIREGVRDHPDITALAENFTDKFFKE